MIDQMSREELEGEIVANKSLYVRFDETRLLNGGYTLDEMRAIVTQWIIDGDECAN